MDDNDVTRWLSGLKSGDAGAIEALWLRYFDRLVRLAGRRLPDGMRRVFDGEDVALSAFDSLCRGAAEGRFPRLDGRDDLWRLLVCLTARKAQLFLRHQGRRKRGGGLVRGESAFLDADGGGSGLAQVLARGPTPEFAAQLAEQFRALLDRLEDEPLRAVALLKMEGYTNEEIAGKLGCARRSVERRLHMIRKAWSEGEPEESPGPG